MKETITFRPASEIKEPLQQLAKKEKRSISNLINYILIKYLLGTNGKDKGKNE